MHNKAKQNVRGVKSKPEKRPSERGENNQGDGVENYQNRRAADKPMMFAYIKKSLGLNHTQRTNHFTPFFSPILFCFSCPDTCLHFTKGSHILQNRDFQTEGEVEQFSSLVQKYFKNRKLIGLSKNIMPPPYPQYLHTPLGADLQLRDREL